PRARSAHSGFTRTRPATVTTRPTLGIHHVRLAGVLAALCLHLGHLAGGGGGGWIVQGQLEARIAWNRRPSVAEAVMPRGASAPAPARRNRRRGWREGLQQPVHARAHVMAEGQEGRAELVVLGFEGGDLVGESVRFLKRLVAGHALAGVRRRHDLPAKRLEQKERPLAQLLLGVRALIK